MLDVGEREGAAQHVADVAGRGEAGHRLGVAAARGFEIPDRPVREPDQRGGAASAEVVGRLGEVERTVGVLDRPLGVPGDERERGAVHLHLRREAGELRVVEHDRRRRVDGGVEPSLDALQERLDPGDLTADHERTDELDAQHRSGREELVGQGREPPASGRLLPGLEHDRRGQLDELCGPLDVVAGHRVGDRLGLIARRLVPGARSPMQLVDPLGLLVQHPRPQHVGEEVVVAVPEAAIVERDEEEVRPIELLEHRLPAAATGHGIAQRPGEPVEDRGLEQEAPDLVGLALRAPPRRGSRRRSGRRRRSSR